MEHADGTMSVVPIENRRYLRPYAEVIASMIGSGTVNNINVTLAYDASSDASQLARGLARELRLMERMTA